MKLNSFQLEAFAMVAKTLNFTRAAEALHITQSALSQRIAKLEADLETTLFVREKNAVRLTEAAHRVLRFYQLSDRAETEMLASLKGSQTSLGGVLRIGGFSSVNRSIVIPALSRLLIANPELSIQLLTRELHELDDLLKRAEVDYIVTTAKSEAMDIESVYLGSEENVLVRAKKHKPARIFLDHDERDPVTKSYLAQHSGIAKPMRMRYLDDVYGLIDGVKNGYGVAVLPRHLIENEKDLVRVDKKRSLKTPVYLQFFRQPYYGRAHNLIVEDLRSEFRRRLS